MAEASVNAPMKFVVTQTWNWIGDVGANFTSKQTVDTSDFFCQHDTEPAIFRLRLIFGNQEEGWISAFISPTNRDVSLSMIKITLFDEKKELVTKKAMPKPSVNVKLTLGHGFRKFYQPESLVAKVNWRFVFEFEYEASSPVSVIPPLQSFSHLKDDLLHLLETSSNSDITFTVKGGNVILAHKAILVARSAHFKRMFDSDMKENATNEVDVPDTEVEVFKGMLEYLYSGLPPKNLPEIATDLLLVADMYLLEELKIMCVSSICSNLKVETLVDTLLLAKQFNCEKLMERGKVFLKANIGAVKRCKKKWEKLMADPALLLKLVEDLCIE